MAQPAFTIAAIVSMQLCAAISADFMPAFLQALTSFLKGIDSLFHSIEQRRKTFLKTISRVTQ